MKKYIYLGLLMVLTIGLSFTTQAQNQRTLASQKPTSSMNKLSSNAVQNSQANMKMNRANTRNQARQNSAQTGYKEGKDGKMAAKSSYHDYELFAGNTEKDPVSVINLYDRTMAKVATISFYKDGVPLKDANFDKEEKLTNLHYSMSMFDHFKDILENGKTLEVEVNPKTGEACVKTSAKESRGGNSRGINRGSRAGGPTVPSSKMNRNVQKGAVQKIERN